MHWILVSLVLVAGVAQSEEPALRQIDASKKITNSSNANQRGSATLPLVIEVAPSSELNVKTEGDPRKVDEKATNETVITYSTLALAICTFLLSVFTLGLMLYTARLWGATKTLLKKADDTAKTHERAYIVCGGLFGVPNESPQSAEDIYRPKARNFHRPWRMVIHNHGRSPGFITKIQWGAWPRAEFDENLSVTQIIKKNKVANKIHTVEIQDVFAPTGDTPLFYRYVDYDHLIGDRKVGDVFFGRIDYEDIFGLCHHSTFAVLHDIDHSDTIGRSFTRDWS
jgi:hypothetical protein